MYVLCINYKALKIVLTRRIRNKVILISIFLNKHLFAKKINKDFVHPFESLIMYSQFEIYELCDGSRSRLYHLQWSTAASYRLILLAVYL